MNTATTATTATILATVNIGKHQISQHWEFVEGDPEPYIKTFVLENGQMVLIQLRESLVKDVQGQKVYLGTLNFSDYILCPS